MSEQGGLRLRERNRIRTRQELLDAALELFEAGGLSACSVEAVAKRAGAAKTTAYSYFPGGVDEMLRDIYRGISDEVRKRGEDAWAAGADPDARILGLAMALLDACSQPRVGRFYMMLSPALSPLLEPVVGETSRRFHALITKEISRGPARKPAARARATLIVGAMREAAMEVARSPARREALTSALAAAIRALI